jgi:hypothetical protein
MGQFLQALLLFLAGWSLSQYRYSLRSEYRSEQWKSQVKEWMLQLESHSEMVVETEIQLVQEREQARLAMQKAMLRQSELEMALDLARSKAMVQEKALGWDLQ